METVVSVRKAGQEDIQSLSKRFLRFLEDKNSKIYKENVEKFGIPEEYVRKALAEETLIKAAATGKATFYVALDGDEIVGFAQIVQRDVRTAELDRIVVFPTYERKGVGTQLLVQAVEDAKKRETEVVIVNAGRNETRARRFYEKNGFRLVKEVTVEAPWGKKLDLATYQLQLGSHSSFDKP